MYLNTSEAYNETILKDSRTFRARMSHEDEVIDSGFTSIKIIGGSNSAETITIGSTISQRVEVEMMEPAIALSNKEWQLSLGLLVEDDFEYIPVGYFTPEKPLTNNGKTTFKAYDRMMRLSRTYVCTLDNINTVTVLNDISEITGVPIDTSELIPIPMNPPEDFTCREVLMYVSQMYGCFANVSRDGIIELHWWTEVDDYVITPDNTIGFQHDESEYVLGYLAVSAKDENNETISLLAGSGDRGISIANPFMTKAVVDDIFLERDGFSYTVSNVECPAGDIRLDPWDMIQITDTKGSSYRMPLMNIEFEYDGGVSAKYSCVGNSKAEEETDYKGPMQMLQEKMEAKVEGLRGAVSIIQQTAGQVLVQNTDENGTLTTIIDTKSWEAKFVNSEGMEVSGIYFDFKKAQFVFNGTGHYTGSIDVNEKFIVDSAGNVRIFGGRFYALDEDGEVDSLTTVDKDGLTVYSKDTVPAIKIGFPKGNAAYPYIRLNSGENTNEQCGVIKKFANGMWMGNDAPADASGYFEAKDGYLGMFYDFTDGEVYVVNGRIMKSIYTGESIARFG